MPCNFLGCIKCVFEMSFIKSALLTMEFDVPMISENGDIKIMKPFKII